MNEKLPLILTAIALAVVGCGGSSDHAVQSPSAPSPHSRQARAKALTARFYLVEKEGNEAHRRVENAILTTGDREVEKAGEAVEARTLKERRAILRQMHGLVATERARVAGER